MGSGSTTNMLVGIRQRNHLDLAMSCQLFLPLREDCVDIQAVTKRLPQLNNKFQGHGSA